MTHPTSGSISLHFDRGTLLLRWSEGECPESVRTHLKGVEWDDRVRNYRAPAWRYRDLVLALHTRRIPFEDNARQFVPTEFSLQKRITPRDFQQEALEAWLPDKRGVVSLPTGAGKTILALLLITKTHRPTLIHVPTLDLMRQWQEVLEEHLGIAVGLIGGGQHEVRDITVTTYDSALIHVSQLGNRFGMLVFDECHHLPGEQYQFAALGSLAPFRLGLTATPERADGRESVLWELIGPLCYETHIDELQGDTLAPYRVETIPVKLSAEEQAEYQQFRERYTGFLRRERIFLGKSNGWQIFLWKCNQSAEGREAFQAYLAQKRLAQAASEKTDWVWRLLRRHAGDRIIIFTQDNDMAYRLGRCFFLPVLTHQTKLPERKALLDAFRNGIYPVLVTSKVLNEGVDVPEANVGLIVSGSGSVREHVQRLGRLLRGRPGKQAVLYELVSQNTGEQSINKRRRQHRAYERSAPLPGA